MRIFQAMFLHVCPLNQESQCFDGLDFVDNKHSPTGKTVLTPAIRKSEVRLHFLVGMKLIWDGWRIWYNRAVDAIHLTEKEGMNELDSLIYFASSAIDSWAVDWVDTCINKLITECMMSHQVTYLSRPIKLTLVIDSVIAKIGSRKGK